MSESEQGTWGGRRAAGNRSASQLSHQSSHASHSHSQSHRSHCQSQHSYAFSYSHAAPSAIAAGGPPNHHHQHHHHHHQHQASCAHSERSHASSYGPPGLPPPYCMARYAPKASAPSLVAASSNSPPGAPPVRELADVPPELTASRQSFQHAMGNPCEFFVDIM